MKIFACLGIVLFVGASAVGCEPVAGNDDVIDDGENQCIPDCGSSECGMDPVCGTLNCGSCGDGKSCMDGECKAGTGLCSDGMCHVPEGSFWMGCNDGVDGQCQSDERPYHLVSLSGFYIDRTEVTVDSYRECVTAGTCSAPFQGDYCNWFFTDRGNHPVNCVTWDQAASFCTWAGKRLPTEAEWEKAARGTEGRIYPWGNETATCDHAVMVDGCGTLATWAVCGKSPSGDSPYGLCDMSGNVSEWVSDWYDSVYYTNLTTLNPTGPASGTKRVTRGGDYLSKGAYLRASRRYQSFPSNNHYVLGFRCVRDE